MSLGALAVTETEVQDLVLRAIENANVARMPGLVSLLIDIDDALRDRGIEVLLSDARAMSQQRSLFRSVAGW
jgi:hypothetical protein